MNATPRPLRFVVDGELVELTARDVPDRFCATTTLLDYLREQRQCTAVKEGCAEGDCGACTVVVGELDAAADGGTEQIRWRAVNSCLRFLPTLDGKEVVTAQGLAAPDGTLHPVQQAMVDHHASQCGFCTPGLVMSLFARYLATDATNKQKPTRDELLTVLSGNLCRCTGYRPIIDAGLAMHDYPPPQCASAADANANATRVARLQRWRDEPPLQLPGYRAPRSVDEFAAHYAAHPESLILAGGTDLGLWVTQQLRDLPPLIYVGDVVELASVREHAEHVEIGAAVRLEDAFAALLAGYPELDDLARRFASLPIRNSGTLCGNVANGSPIGDALPALIALAARVRLRRGDVIRELPLEDFYLGYQKKDLAPGEFVAAVVVPKRRPAARYALYKVAKRSDQDISAVCAGFSVEINPDSGPDSDAGVVTAVRLAYGGMAATPRRATHAEQALLGARWGEAALARAQQALRLDFTPQSDLRASSAYRRALAANLLRRFWLESQGDAATRIAALEPAEPAEPAAEARR